MAWFSSKVEVTFVDDITGEPIGITKMPPTDLPESFELDTTLHIGNQDWTVVAAEPKTRNEYAKSKELKLRLRRIQTMDPGDILYSLPSICDVIPGSGNQPLSGTEFVLAEDDWRQFEFVSRELAQEVDSEIERIRLIHENASAKAGWREIHVRSKIESPLTCDISLDDLTDAFQVSGNPTGVSYHCAKSQVADGYAFNLGGFTVYGTAPGGGVQTIAFDQYSASPADNDALSRLRAVAQSYELDLVYWCRCVRVSPDDSLFDSLLLGSGDQ